MQGTMVNLEKNTWHIVKKYTAYCKFGKKYMPYCKFWGKLQAVCKFGREYMPYCKFGKNTRHILWTYTACLPTNFHWTKTLDMFGKNI